MSSVSLPRLSPSLLANKRLKPICWQNLFRSQSRLYKSSHACDVLQLNVEAPSTVKCNIITFIAKLVWIWHDHGPRSTILWSHAHWANCWWRSYIFCCWQRCNLAERCGEQLRNEIRRLMYVCSVAALTVMIAVVVFWWHYCSSGTRVAAQKRVLYVIITGRCCLQRMANIRYSVAFGLLEQPVAGGIALRFDWWTGSWELSVLLSAAGCNCQWCNAAANALCRPLLLDDHNRLSVNRQYVVTRTARSQFL